MKISLLDYGAGNATSVERALRRLGANPERSNSPESITNAEAIILPGVGHYSALIRALDKQNLRPALLDALHRAVPFLGICLGLQALYETSAESPGLSGLHLLTGTVSSLPATVKLPHMGWNQLKLTHPSRLLEGISPDAYFYFAHSSPPPTPMGKWSLSAHTERISPPSSKNKISSPSNSIPRKAATPVRAFSKTS